MISKSPRWARVKTCYHKFSGTKSLFLQCTEPSFSVNSNFIFLYCFTGCSPHFPVIMAFKPNLGGGIFYHSVGFPLTKNL